MCCLHGLLEAVFFLSFQLSKELIEVLLVLNGLLLLRRLGFGQCHGGADGETQNRSYIGASLFCLDSFLPFFGIFAVILDQPNSRCQSTTSKYLFCGLISRTAIQFLVSIFIGFPPLLFFTAV